ncbi:MAG: hypothetical protein UHJ41_08530 [Bacteroidaceae bacterium]|nr:hypothetical protein [Bacteroidaceae bacterium]
MRRAAHTLGLFFALLMLLPVSLYAEVYSIDFNRGAKSGGLIETSFKDDVSAHDFCSAGASYITEISIADCFYDNAGCGLRIGKETGSGFAFVTFSLSAEISSKSIERIVVYASRETSDTDSDLQVNVSGLSQKISYADILAYDSSTPGSLGYMLPAVDINKQVRQLQIKAHNTNFVMLHRIDIIMAEDGLTLPAQSGGLNYATFSSGKATFFPEEVTVSKVSVVDGLLCVSPLVVQNGCGRSGRYVPANTGVLLSSQSGEVAYYTLDGEMPDALSDNMLCPAAQPMTADARFYKLAYDDFDGKTALGFYWGAADGGAFSCKSGTAYLAVPSASSGAKGFVLDGAADEDAIRTIAETPDEMGDFYNLAGLRSGASLRGIYIKDGKKYVGK